MSAPTHKAEALQALEQARMRLCDPVPLDGVRRAILLGLVEYALAEVEAIVEVKRVRRRAPTAQAEPEA